MRRATIRQHSKPDSGRISIHALLAESDSAACLACKSCSYFYPRSPCGERRQHRIPILDHQPISIHALLAESDPPVREIIQWEGIFLSTLSLRRATFPSFPPSLQRLYFYPRSPCGERPCQWRRSVKLFRHFYPRSPCGERHLRVVDGSNSSIISIHALLAESDHAINLHAEAGKGHFYPRSPCGERLLNSSWISSMRNFYPRSPCGERRIHR